jgi:hypothetical protein
MQFDELPVHLSWRTQCMQMAERLPNNITHMAYGVGPNAKRAGDQCKRDQSLRKGSVLKRVDRASVRSVERLRWLIVRLADRSKRRAQTCWSHFVRKVLQAWVYVKNGKSTAVRSPSASCCRPDKLWSSPPLVQL